MNYLKNNRLSNKNKGFTLVELMIVLAIGSILMSMAIPSFTSTIKNNRLTTQANELISSLNYARSEAIRRGASVTLNSTSTNTNWHSGWTIDDNTTATIRNHEAFDGNSTLVAGGSVNSVTYLGTGFISGSSTITYTLCDDRTGETGRTISISLTGRPSVSDVTCS